MHRTSSSASSAAVTAASRCTSACSILRAVVSGCHWCELPPEEADAGSSVRGTPPPPLLRYACSTPPSPPPPPSPPAWSCSLPPGAPTLRPRWAGLAAAATPPAAAAVAAAAARAAAASSASRITASPSTSARAERTCDGGAGGGGAGQSWSPREARRDACAHRRRAVRESAQEGERCGDRLGLGCLRKAPLHSRGRGGRGELASESASKPR